MSATSNKSSADSSSAVVSVTAQLSKAVLDKLIELAEKRGVSANTVVEQAIVNESYFDKEEAKGSKVLIEKPNRSIVKLDFSR